MERALRTFSFWVSLKVYYNEEKKKLWNLVSVNAFIEEAES